MTIHPPLTHVAIRFQSRIWSLPRPYRHHHVLRTILWLAQEFGEYTGEVVNKIDAHGEDQGFLDADGRYLTRKQALASAEANNQIKGGKLIGSILTSEDLW